MKEGSRVILKRSSRKETGECRSSRNNLIRKKRTIGRNSRNMNKKLRKVKIEGQHSCLSLRRREPSGNWKETVSWTRSQKWWSPLTDFKTKRISFWEKMRNSEMKTKIAESTCLPTQLILRCPLWVVEALERAWKVVLIRVPVLLDM